MSSAHDSHPQQVEPSVQPFRDGDLSTHIAEVAEKHTGRLVGFLGLGNMGLPMATHLAGRGIRLCVYDPGKSDASYHLQKQFGAVPACSVADLGSKLRASFLSHGNVETETCEGSTRQEVLRRCVEPVSDQGRAFRSTSFPAVSHSAALQKEPHVAEWQHDANQILRENRDFAACGAAPPFPVVISMLPSGRHVEEALLSDNGLLRALEGASGKAQDSLDLCRAFVIDCSTIGPLHAVEIAERVTRRGHHFVDAPVSGGVPAATAGTLTFMAGGSTDEVSVASSLLRLMGSRVVHCGEAVGTGQAFKVCNNLILAASMLGVAEAFRLGEALGVDLKLLNDVVNASSGRCWSAEQYNPAPGIVATSPASRAYSGGFSVDLIVKDLLLCKGAFEAQSLKCPVTDAVLTMFRRVSDKGHRHLDIGCAFLYNT
uniref:3-hydroxyisobutyrate dehydrogenase n=1 Tax=Toxoplasma gondii (strain ATCC 50861 / VEG) TaxID=432359 RepID=A0A0F7V331_TOXGV|nr:TPA: 3-hydroxyisobutyrate dehydrogenase, putative [Toxoplasma gondii VEG]